MIEYIPNSFKSRLQNTIFNDVYDYLTINRIDICLGGEKVGISVPRSTYQFERMEENRIYEEILSNELYYGVSQDTILFDIGSYFGYYPQIAVAGGSDPDNIYAFEANRIRCQIISKCCPNIHTIYSQVGSKDSKVSIDGFVEENNVFPDYVKIDVDGYEYEVLDGAESTLRNDETTFYIEIHPFYLKRRGYSHDDILQLLQKSNRKLLLSSHTTDNEWVAPDEFNFEEFDFDIGAHNTYLAKVGGGAE